MCLLCEDDSAYRAYMAYLDEMRREGRAVDPDAAMDALLDKLEALQRTAPGTTLPDTTLSTHTPGLAAAPRRCPPRSPFSCDPVDE